MKVIILALGLLILASLLGCGVKHSVTTPPHTPVEPPERPSSLQGQALTSSSIQLTWSDNSNNEEYFAIYRREGISDFDTFALCQRVFFNTTTCTDGGLRDSTTYSYYVTAERGDTCSRQSNTINVTTMSHDSEIPVIGSIVFPGAGACIGSAYSSPFMISTRSGMVYEIDASDHANPHISQTYQAGGEIISLYYIGMIYLAMGETGLRTLWMQYPDPPEVTGTLNTPGSVTGLCQTGNWPTTEIYWYVVDGASIQIINNTDQPQIVGEFRSQLISHINNADGDNAAVYLACGEAGLQILNTTNPLSPTIQGHLNIPGGVGKVYLGRLSEHTSRLYMLNASPNLYIADISNNTNPTLMSTFNIGESTKAIFLSGNFIYVSFNGGLKIVNVANPSQPQQVAFFPDNQEISTLKVDGEYIEMVDNAGLKILRYMPPSQ
jgi:hypothetical protein